ncbi:MAG: DNA polymerase I [Legionellales bacterium RIFCSPHIGHO2_12_FULL_35_11]|nr:MAG: DNA polymerase I [Legionellales bacterium RIFCSPHIGHO2_12_FULL_35_11]
MSKPLVLVDGSSYFFRAFHALPPLITSRGQPTGAIYGVANMIKRLIKDYEPEQIVTVFDAKEKTFRDEIYPEYKAHRPPTPKDLSSQFEPLMEVLSALGLPILTIPGVEADDVIGTISNLAKNAEKYVIISTGDKDMAQLVNSHISLINTMSNTTMDEHGVFEKFGVKPNQIIDYLTLVGDASDNIPGVTKCGPKTAVKWLTEYATLENLIANADKIPGKIGENLRTDIPKLALSKQLVTIKTDVQLPLGLDDFHLKKINQEKLLELAHEFEFQSWVKDLTKTTTATNQTTNSNFSIITKPQDFLDFIKNITTSSLLCIDLETTSLNAINAEIVGIAMALDVNNPIYIPIAHTEQSNQIACEFILQHLKPILENKEIKKIGQNLKYDYTVFKNYDISLTGIASDTMLESYLLNSSSPRHDMDTLALKYLHHTTIKYNDVVGSGAKEIPFQNVPITEAAAYAAEDAEITLKLHHKLFPQLSTKLKTILHELEVPLISILANIERYGVLIDPTLLKTQGERLKAQIKAYEQKAIEIVGRNFNLNSPKQLQEILFDELKLPVIAKTPKGQPSTSESVLQELAENFELPNVILNYRSLTKLVSTYIDALPKQINPNTNRVHTSYNQAITATGRLSSSNPNLQNIPIRNEEGRQIRRAFIAPEGNLLLTADYSQIELRIMAHLSQDKSLLDAFANGLDIHTATASEIFGVSLAEVTQTQRRRSKAINFGLIYGMSAFGLAKQLQIDRKDAQTYIDRYFTKYPGVLKYMEETKEKGRANGYVETIYGRRLYLPEINDKNMIRRKAAERIAINAPLQGTAADIIKMAMIKIANWQMNEARLKSTMIMQVHDELVFEVATTQIEEIKKQVQNIMEGATELSVPLLVSVGVGNNWDEAH